MLGELTPCGGGTPIVLFQRRLVVGRSRECEVCIPARSVSSRHCEFRYDGERWHVRDLDSRNGIAVNGKQCVESPLQPGDVVWIARERFRIRYVLPPGATTAVPKSDTQSGPQPVARESNSLGRLVPCGGGDPIPLINPVLTVGRRSRCDIQLRFTTVSSEHCRLEFKEGYWFVQDMQSTNGIRINDKRCESGWLTPEAVLSVGTHRYRIHYTPTGDNPPPQEDPFAVGLLEKAGLEKGRQSTDSLKWGEKDDPFPAKKRWTLDD